MPSFDRMGDPGLIHAGCVAAQSARYAAQEQEIEARRVTDIRSFAAGQGTTGMCTIPQRGWTWCNVTTPEFKARVSPKFRAFANTFKFDRSAVLLGLTGKGKTSAVYAGLFALRAEAETSAIASPGQRATQSRGLCALRAMQWYSGSQIALARKQYALGKGEATLLEDAIASTILVVDEVGFETLDSALFDVVDARYNRQRPTIITTGLTVEAFKGRYGDALWRRLTELGLKVEDFGG